MIGSYFPCQKVKNLIHIMRKIIYILFSMAWITGGFAQSNLVLNPSFEDNSGSRKEVKKSKKKGYLANYWYSPLSKQSPDIYRSPKRNVAKANSGQAAVGLVLGGSKQEKTKYEYITGELSKPLVRGKVYCVSFYLLLHRSSRWAESNVGIIFHHDKKLIANVRDLQKLSANLSANNGEYVTNTKWRQYNGYFIASGGEKYISFGVFGGGDSRKIRKLGIKPYYQLDVFQAKAYYQLDDVSVIENNDSIDCACAEPLKEESYKIIEEKELKPYLFALDVSGSMRKNGVFDSLRNNIISLLRKLPMGTPVTLTTFASNSKLVFSGKLNHNTIREADSLLSKVKLGGGTNVLAGLSKAYRSWIAEGQDSAHIFLISDGDFKVTNKIENLVKSEFENKARQLTVVHIDSKAKDSERLEPYQTSYVYTSSAELSSAVFQIYEPNIIGVGAYACDCINEYSDTMNYHFIIDYSGSMGNIGNSGISDRVINEIKYLYDRVPSTAVVSITTTVNNKTNDLYVGIKSNMPTHKLEHLLKPRTFDNEGCNAVGLGIVHGLDISQRMTEKHFSHLIVVTDLELNSIIALHAIEKELGEKYTNFLDEHLYNDRTNFIQKSSDMAGLDISYVRISHTVTNNSLITSDHSYRQFDATAGIFLEVSQVKFEMDLFMTMRSSCNYTTQAYHFNPASHVAKKILRKVIKKVLKKIEKNLVNQQQKNKKT